MSAAVAGPRARLLLTGDELLRGFIQDANSGFIAAELHHLGVELDEIRIVGDDFDAISAALKSALACDGVGLVVVTGGLGPTHDDRTSEAVAAAIGRGLVLDEAALEIVEARVRAYGRMRTAEEIATFTPGNRKQATLPAGSSWVDPLGTAPGYAVGVTDDRLVVVLPGPPSELRHAWRGIVDTTHMQSVVAHVPARHERLLRLWGVPESRASQVLAASGHRDTVGCRVTICARDGELEVSIRGADAAAVDRLTDQLGVAFESACFAHDDHRSVVELVAVGLIERGWTLGLAESCTGGMLGSIATSAGGASEWFVGSLVTYSNDAKASLGRVDPRTIQEHGAVSEQVARSMAAGARAALCADVGIGITGIAGPGGGSDGKPVGTVHVALSSPTGDAHRQLRIPGDRDTVRRRSCVIALHELRRLLATDG